MSQALLPVKEVKGVVANGRYHSHRVELLLNMETEVPSELRHLEVAGEYAEVVRSMREGSRLALVALCGVVVFSLAAVGSFFGVLCGRRVDDRHGTWLAVPAVLGVLSVLCGCLQVWAKKRKIAEVQSTCDSVNERLSSKKTTFSVAHETRYDHDGSRSTEYYLVTTFFTPSCVKRPNLPSLCPSADYGSAKKTVEI